MPLVELDAEACYRALVARDVRFDGAFFVGVRTTGIYCRPVCRARTPRRERCEFFPRAAHAERAGFRACFRCRPERAPGHASVDAVSRLVARAARRIDEGALNHGSVEHLARTLGVGGRHLRRVMQGELGIGPLELALSKRVALGRELLRNTALPVAQVALASGFSSVRRFNDAYRKTQGMTPSQLRRPRPDGAPESSVVCVVLDARPPFDAQAAFAFLRARAVPGAEWFDDGKYFRAVCVDGARGSVAISRAEDRAALRVEVPIALAPSLMEIAAASRRLFDTDTDPSSIGAFLARDPALAPLVRVRPALRVMGAFDAFEWAVRAVLGQQISVRAALTLASRLLVKLGVPLVAAGQAPKFAWPDPARLAAARPETLVALGLTRARAGCVLGLARAVAEGRLVLDRSADPVETREALLALPGVGPWTAQYIELRALGWPDAFPAADLGLRKALGGVSAAECEALSQRWRPFRAYAAAHLWLSLAARTGET